MYKGEYGCTGTTTYKRVASSEDGTAFLRFNVEPRPKKQLGDAIHEVIEPPLPAG